jgi:hypothetical protein
MMQLSGFHQKFGTQLAFGSNCYMLGRFGDLVGMFGGCT